VTSVITTVHQVDTPLDAQRKTLRKYDAMGRLVAEMGGEGSKALTGLTLDSDIQAVWSKYATQYQYDKAGRRVLTIEPNGKDGNGNKTAYYYDKVGRLSYTINSLGEVQSYTYNAFGQQEQVRQYATRGAVNSSTLAGGLSSQFTAPAASANDALTRYSYGASGDVNSKLVYGKRTSTSSSSAIVETETYFYDSKGNFQEKDTDQLWVTYVTDKRGLVTSISTQKAVDLSAPTQTPPPLVALTILKGTSDISFWTIGSSKRRPIMRLTE